LRLRADSVPPMVPHEFVPFSDVRLKFARAIAILSVPSPTAPYFHGDRAALV